MTDTPICAVPGCGRELYERNKTGVCRAHNHRQPYCMCVQCTRKYDKPRYRVVTPEEVQALNRQTKMTGSGVSLPAEPWRDTSKGLKPN